MSTNEFDRLVRDKFDSGEFEYKPEGWQQLSRRIDLTPPEKAIKAGASAGMLRWLPKAGIAAGVAALIGLSVLFFNRTKSTTDITPTAGVQPAATSGHTQAPVVTTPATPSVAPPSVAATNVPVVVAGHNRGAANKTIVPQQQAQQPVNTTVVPQANTNNEHIAQANTTQPQTQPANNKKPSVQLPKQPDFSENAYAEDGHRRTGRTSFSLAGGVNYGSLNTGYTLGVSARRKLGTGRFYLEGDLAFVNSNAPKAAAVSEAQYDALSSNYTGGSKNTGNTGASAEPAALAAVPAPVKSVSQEQALNSLYYLQLSPSVGYNIKKNISVSLGADVQRLLQNNNNEETPVVLTSDQLKLIPQTDVGLTGRAEYGVTRRLKAGMLYREGVNALIDNKYINRRYVQVQLKFMLFGK